MLNFLDWSSVGTPDVHRMSMYLSARIRLYSRSSPYYLHLRNLRLQAQPLLYYDNNSLEAVVMEGVAMEGVAMEAVAMEGVAM